MTNESKPMQHKVFLNTGNSQPKVKIRSNVYESVSVCVNVGISLSLGTSLLNFVSIPLSYVYVYSMSALFVVTVALLSLFSRLSANEEWAYTAYRMTASLLLLYQLLSIVFAAHIIIIVVVNVVTLSVSRKATTSLRWGYVCAKARHCAMTMSTATTTHSNLDKWCV